ncbi:MAG: hypothetical protein ACKVS9_03600 [Phycisphaerae bacterium]
MLVFIAFAGSFASADIRFDRIGRWGGTCNAVTIRGDLAYVGIGPRLVVLDISDPQNPTRIGQTEPLGGSVIEIAIQGDFGYVSVSQVGLRIVDIRQATHPLALPNTLAPNYAYHVAVAGPLVCTASYWTGFRLYDVTNPFQPVELFQFETEGASGGDVQFLDGHLYYAGNSRLRVFDLSTPHNPTLVSEVPGIGATTMVARDGLIVAAMNWTTLGIVDVSQPATPIVLAEVWFDAVLIEPTIVLSDDRALVLDQRGRMTSINLADPHAPQVSNSIDPGSYVRYGAIAMQGKVAWIAKPYLGLTAYSVPADAAPIERGSYAEAESVLETRVFGHNAFLLGHSGIVRWLDVSAPEQPITRATFGENARAIEFDGRFAFVGMVDGLAIFDLLAPGGPREVARPDLNALVYALALHEDVLFVGATDEAWPWSGELYMLDVASPADPDWYYWFTWAPSARLKIRDGRLFMQSAWFGALTVFDLSVPEAPNDIAYFPTRGPGKDFEIVAGHAYIQTDYGIDVLDISDLADIRPGAFIRHLGGSSIATNGELLFTSGEVLAYGLSNPDRPDVVGAYQTRHFVSAVEYAAGCLYVSSIEGGLEILTARRRGDVNGDDLIGLEDLAGVLAAFGTCDGQAAFNRYADWNQDGCVELFDLAAMLGAIE